MDRNKLILFPPYELDPANLQLLKGGHPVALRQKAFAVLQYLVKRPGTLVKKEELLDAVWPGTFVGEGALAGCIRELRQALADPARDPKFIETAHRLGYRFIAEVRAQPKSKTSREHAAEAAASSLGHDDSLVGREAQLEQLRGCFERVLHGERQVVFVSGEAGVGKTVLVDHFLSSFVARRSLFDRQRSQPNPHADDEARGTSDVLLVRAQCIDQRGVPESFLPIFDALGHLCRAPEGSEVLEALRRYVPACLPLLGGLSDTKAIEGVSGEPVGRERTARLLVEMFEALSQRSPVVLVLEDLQWSDEASLMFLSCLARRSAAARLMAIGTNRSVDVVASGHPLRALQQELRTQRKSVEVSLGLLDARAVREWLVGKVGEVDLLDSLAAWLHQRTEGSPLFLVNVFEHLLARGSVRCGEGRWVIHPGFETVGVPQSLRHMIEGYLDVLDPGERQLIEAASVIGVDFNAAAIAACLQRDLVAVEEACDAFMRRTHIIRGRQPVEWPDGTVSAGYGFVHALYQEIVYGRLGAAYRGQLHLRLGERLERGLGPQATENAALLAVHFERGRDARRAAAYRQQAGMNAMRLALFPEASEHLAAALALLRTLPASEVAHQELAAQIALGGTLASMEGYAAAAVGRALTRARELCSELGERSLLGWVLLGLWSFHNARAEYHTAEALARDLIRHGEETGQRSLPLWGTMSLVHSLTWLGELAEAYACFERGIELYDPDLHGTEILIVTQDPKALGQRPAASVLWALGYPDRALALSEETLATARDQRRHAYATAQALYSLAVQYTLRREVTRVGDCTDQLIAHCAEHHFPFLLSRGQMLRAWVDGTEGRDTGSIAVLREGCAAFSDNGALQGRSFFLALLADAQLRVSEVNDALATLEEALRFVRETDERYFTAELHRLRGEVLAIQGDAAAAELSLLQGLEVARHQQARSWELRCAISLARLWMTQHRSREALDQLAPVHAGFTEGFATHDLESARTLLDELLHSGG